MSTAADIRIAFDLPDEESQALAQFVKRVTWTAMRECRQIRAAIDKLQRALADAGYAPR